MYKIGTLVLYDKRGVYKIEGVGPPPVQGTSGNYYKLRAVFSNSNEIIYTPVDMVTSMRPLIINSEAANYLEQFAQMEPRVFRSGKATDLERRQCGQRYDKAGPTRSGPRRRTGCPLSE